MDDEAVIAAWQANVAPWCETVRQRQIPSRVAITDRAILSAILETRPDSLLDVGCGEGWLVRALQGSGIHCFGIDGIAGMIERARELGGGEFHILTYARFAAGAWQRPVDMVVFNFSLLGEGDCEAPLAALGGVLRSGGRCLVQTLHPVFCDFGASYRSGWRAGSWAGFNEQFCEPPPWYYRTLADWLDMFRRCELAVDRIREPLAAGSIYPASIIFELSLRNGTHA